MIAALGREGFAKRSVARNPRSTRILAATLSFDYHARLRKNGNLVARVLVYCRGSKRNRAMPSGGGS